MKLNDRIITERIADAGRTYVRSSLTWRQHAQRLTEVYRELVPDSTL